jgi:hypothetical protein
MDRMKKRKYNQNPELRRWKDKLRSKSRQDKIKMRKDDQNHEWRKLKRDKTIKISNRENAKEKWQSQSPIEQMEKERMITNIYG